MSEILKINSSNTIVPGQPVTIFGVDFGFTAKTVVASPVDSPSNSVAITYATFTSWTDTKIILVPPPNSPIGRPYWFVKGNDGMYNAHGFFAPNRAVTVGTYVVTFPETAVDFFEFVERRNL